MRPLIVTPLGGVGRFGRNCLVLEEEGGPALLIDCGARFLNDDEAPGFDVALPDLAAIEALGDRLLAYVVTHGHEDHIGALPFAARVNAKPIITTPYTARLVGRRFDRVGEKLPAMKTVMPGTPDDSVELGPFRVRFLAVSHSIPDASCVVIDTPAGRVVHSGDFRVDLDPVLGPPTDLEGLTRAGDEGVALLLADSTGAHIEGHNAGERSVLPGLRQSVQGATGRVVVACFASHIQRLALLGTIARDTGRTMAFLGRGLHEHHRIASDLRMLNLDDVLVKEEHLKALPAHEQLWVVTGSQGEEGAGLFRLARDTAPFSLQPGDRVVLSARTIPGNELKIARITDALANRGVEIIDGARSPHVSGHGMRADLEELLLAVRPRDFAPLHGDARHLLAHEALVQRAGLAPAHIHDLRDGSSLFVDADGARVVDGERAPEPYASHGGVTLEAGPIVAARSRMRASGVLIVRAGPDGVELVVRGVFPPLDGELLHAVRERARDAMPKVGTDEEPDAVRALAQLFWRRGRPPPEIVLLA